MPRVWRAVAVVVLACKEQISRGLRACGREQQVQRIGWIDLVMISTSIQVHACSKLIERVDLGVTSGNAATALAHLSSTTG